MAAPATPAAPRRLVNVLMVGAGEYNCGFTPQNALGAAPDKKAGVVAVVLLDLKRRGRLGRVLLADVDGRRLAPARACMAEKIGAAYRDMDVGCIECWPKDEAAAFDSGAPAAAMDTMQRGDLVIVFVPDSAHAAVAHAAIARGLHVLVAKPLTQRLAEHVELVAAAEGAGVILATEYHKRWDPVFSDARERARGLGPFGFFASHMTQRKAQLDTFAPWAAKRASDISYYLNSHFIDVLAWFVAGCARPERVVAAASTGVADARLACTGVEDTITLLVTWRNADGSAGHSTHTASWVAPTADCHTQQHFSYAGADGELRVDQAHRGYALSAEGQGLAALNPLYMRYVPDARGYFAGQLGYGYRSIETAVEAAQAVADGALDVPTAAQGLAAAAETLAVTAILEAGRRSLDAGGRPVRIVYSEGSGAEGKAGGSGGVVDVAARPCGLEVL